MVGCYAFQNRGDVNHVFDCYANHNRGGGNRGFGRHEYEDWGDSNYVFGRYADQNRGDVNEAGGWYALQNRYAFQTRVDANHVVCPYNVFFLCGDAKVVGRCMVVNSGVTQIMRLAGMRSKLGGDANHVVVRVCALTFIGHWSESCITWFDASGGFSVTVLVIVSSLYLSGS